MTVENKELMHEIVHGKIRKVYGLQIPTPVVDRKRMNKIVDRIGGLPEYNSVELIYDLVRADLITFDEMYLLLGQAVRQPDMLAHRFKNYIYSNEE